MPLFLLLSPLQAVTFGQTDDAQLPQLPSHRSFPALSSASSGGQRLTVRRDRHTPASLGPLHNSAQWLPCTLDLCPFAGEGLGTPEPGLNGTSQGDTELTSQVRGRVERRDARGMRSPWAAETRAGGPQQRARGTSVRVDTRGHVCLRAPCPLPSVPLDKQKPGPCAGVLAVLASRGGGRRAEPQLTGGCGPRSGQRGCAVPLRTDACPQGPQPKPVMARGAFVSGSELQQNSPGCLSGSESLRGPGPRPPTPVLRERRPFLPHPVPAVWKAQWLPSQEDFRGLRTAHFYP